MDHVDSDTNDGEAPTLFKGSQVKIEPDVELRVVQLSASTSSPSPARHAKTRPAKALNMAKTYLKFVGPGMMISVAYIDRGSYATDVQAGASYRFELLFIVLLSNTFAIFLQSLCIKLGTVTGLMMIRTYWPPWMNHLWFLLSAAAIEATDIAEVIGTAIALSLLSNGKIPLLAGCALCPADVFFILALYRSSKASIRTRQVFESFIAWLVIGVAVSFGIQLSYLRDATVREAFLGFVPSSDLVQQLGMYLSCGIVGATVLPHSLILGSGLVQNRLEDFDIKHNLLPPSTREQEHDSKTKSELYRHSLRAIRNCIWYSIADNFISLFTIALFVNSAILIVAGASLDTISGAADASLFGIYDLLERTFDLPVATIFTITLLLSSVSADIVVTMAGQVAFKGNLNCSIKTWKLSLMIRAISVPISMAVAGTLGAHGLNTALVGSQVTLCILLPCISLPLAWFTCQSKYMTVVTDARGRRITSAPRPSGDGVFMSRDGKDDGQDADVALVGATTVNMRNNTWQRFL